MLWAQLHEIHRLLPLLDTASGADGGAQWYGAAGDPR
jgi:hypothetical protein